MGKPKHISEFKEGEMITRANPAITYRTEFNEFIGGNIRIKEKVDTCYIGIPLEYVGRTKKKIYFKSQSNSDFHFKKGTKFGIPYDLFQYDWIKYINPVSLKELEGEFFNKKKLEFMLVNNLFRNEFHTFSAT